MSQESLYLLIALAPLVTAVVAGFFATGFVGSWIGRRGAHLIAILGVAVSFVASMVALQQVMSGQTFDQTVYVWSMIGNVKFEVGFLIDPLSALMMVVVTFVSLMVHIYTIGYMADDLGYNRFFSYISLFTFSMLMLVMSNNMMQIFFGWEAVGLVSYLLIGFYYSRQSSVFASLKAFMVNRVGDVGFVLGIGLLYAYSGTLHYADIFSQADKLAAITFPGTDWHMLTVACLCLFVGAMGKSALAPLHVWLPDSMEGPTPISALIHAATMVTAGIFMVARFSPVFEHAQNVLSFILIIGAFGALFLGLIALVQTDIKKVVAYSTLSQLGYMAVALGASAYQVAIFHLMTHAFFKALLFLTAGSVILGMHHNQDMRHMGGLRKYMPITWITTLIGSLALAGMPFFSGFYSKEHIVEAAGAAGLGCELRLFLHLCRAVRDLAVFIPPVLPGVPRQGALRSASRAHGAGA
ncbi:NADH-quinone oxidoreductase subunit L OS=Castellaniella defragrans OX=75697 GN=HNR28_002497 PE=4 SV=1 [Castellaniella defragrans]